MSGMSTTPAVVGHRYIYTYENGWTYELYVKNATSIDYRIHSGMVGGRWVKGQDVDLADLGSEVFKISWTEPTGTSVVVNLMPALGRLHGTIFFPRWVHENPQKTVLFQNDHLDEMRAYRSQGPTYPLHVVAEFATIARDDAVGPDDETVIAGPPSSLPADFLTRA